MADRLITDAMAQAWMLRQHIQHDADVYATYIWWGVYSPAEALEEFKGVARLCAIRCGCKLCDADMIARESLVEAYRRHQRAHDQTIEAIKTAALAALRAGKDRPAIARDVAQVAEHRDVLPPNSVVKQGIESALKEFRISNAWWKKRVAKG